MILAIVSKMKLKTSLTDVPFAVNDAELLAELGWNVWDKERNINDSLFSEGVLRKLLAKYTSQEWVDFYNHYVPGSLLGTLGVQPVIHILDCTKIPINLNAFRSKAVMIAHIQLVTIICICSMTIGKKLDVTRSTISGYECNSITPSVEQLLRLAILYNVSLDYLMGLEN